MEYLTFWFMDDKGQKSGLTMNVAGMSMDEAYHKAYQTARCFIHSPYLIEVFNPEKVSTQEIILDEPW